MKTLLKTLCFTLTFAITHTSTAAIHESERDACVLYSAKALNQMNTQTVAGCGFSGLRWNSDQEGQRAWCRTVSPNITDVETKARAQQLIKCLNPRTTINVNDLGLPISTLDVELRSAAGRDALERMQQLMAAGGDFTGNQSQLMSTALSSNNLKLAQYLLKVGVPLSTETSNPLAENVAYQTYDVASAAKELALMEWLLRNGVDANSTGRVNDTPLSQAIAANNQKAVQLLLRYGANPNVDIRGGNCQTIMPLDKAVDEGNQGIINLLRQAGARTQAQCGG